MSRCSKVCPRINIEPQLLSILAVMTSGACALATRTSDDTLQVRDGRTRDRQPHHGQTDNGQAHARPAREGQAGEEQAHGERSGGGWTYDTGPCAVERVDLEMRWTECAPATPARTWHCYEALNATTQTGTIYLRTPATGPVVKEAHLVTNREGFPTDWPVSPTDQIARHYETTTSATGFVMERKEPWAPAGEGGSRFGQGATGEPIPADAEAWYVTLNWKTRPPPGTRMLIRAPNSARGVIAAAGYETGPGDPGAIAGVPEEIHFHLGTHHKSPLEVAFLRDQNQPYGPIECGP